jgi:hypothetical protein
VSAFLTFLRRRFQHTFRTVEWDHVPWSLDDKQTAYGFVQGRGWRTAHHERFETLAQALQASPYERFVVKRPDSHSARGIYLLEKADEDRFLSLFTLELMSSADIVAASDTLGAPYWIREECIESPVYGKPIPFDYKFYCFRDQVALVLQIDRNVSPPRFCYFDGAFVPLQVGVDYDFDRTRWLPGPHVLPWNASQLIAMARDLSLATESAFVSVDCYDSPDGPVFGEFTFTPGAPDVKMVTFSERVLAQLDRAIAGEPIQAVGGFDLDYQAFWKAAESSASAVSSLEPEVFSRLAAAASVGDRRYTRRLAVAPKGRLGEHYRLVAALVGALAGDLEQYFSIQNAVQRQSGFLQGRALEEEYLARARAHHSSQDAANPWHRSRLAEMAATRGDAEALAELDALAGSGYQHAERVAARIRAEASAGASGTSRH